jgi:hypothetical protein
LEIRRAFFRQIFYLKKTARGILAGQHGFGGTQPKDVTQRHPATKTT